MSSKSSYIEDTLPQACDNLAALVDEWPGVPDVALELCGEMLQVHRWVLFKEFTPEDVSDFFHRRYDDTERFGGPNIEGRIAAVLAIVAYSYGYHFDGIKGFEQCTWRCLDSCYKIPLTIVGSYQIRVGYAKFLLDLVTVLRRRPSSVLGGGTHLGKFAKRSIKEIQCRLMPEEGYPKEFDAFMRYFYTTTESSTLVTKYRIALKLELARHIRDHWAQLIEDTLMFSGQQTEDAPGYRFGKLMRVVPELFYCMSDLVVKVIDRKQKRERETGGSDWNGHGDRSKRTRRIDSTPRSSQA
jgi:hypothetical protein